MLPFALPVAFEEREGTGVIELPCMNSVSGSLLIEVWVGREGPGLATETGVA
jgi:hypothetical protein